MRKTHTISKEQKLKLELSLIPRLRLMGMIMLLFSIISLSYAFLYQSAPQDDGIVTVEEITGSSGLTVVSTESSDDANFSPHDYMNFFAVSLLFTGIGIACLLTAWKKNKQTRPFLH